MKGKRECFPIVVFHKLSYSIAHEGRGVGGGDSPPAGSRGPLTPGCGVQVTQSPRKRHPIKEKTISFPKNAHLSFYCKK